MLDLGQLDGEGGGWHTTTIGVILVQTSLFMGANALRQRALFGLTYILILGLLSACAEFHEDYRIPAEETAVLEFVPGNEGYRFHAIHIDGRPLRSRIGPISVPSGRRNIAFVYAVGRFAPAEAISGVNVALEGTESYKLHTRIIREESARYVWTWVVEKSSGRIVAGRVPPNCQ